MNLNHGDRVWCRCGRAGRDKVEWEAWKVRKLHVQHDHKNQACVVALTDRSDFAEFDPRRDVETTADTMLLMTEDYYLEIKLPERSLS